jgi:glycosyltransferase involved in cell wall biosynthesis
LIVGGAQENTMYTAAMLNKERFSVEILSGPQTGSEGSLIEEVRSRGASLTILPDLVRQVSPLHDLRALNQMRRFIRRGNFQIVHTHSSKAGILGRLAARSAGVPVIVHTVHGWSFHDYMSPIVRNLYMVLERWMASFTTALIAVTQRDIEKGLQAGIGVPEDYHLIRSAIPLDEFDPTRYDRQAIRKELEIPSGAVVVGNVGRFSQQKNPLDWIRVAGSVARSRPQTHFLLVGDGPLRDEVARALAQENLTGRTTLTGLRRDASRLMAAMDVFMLTSLWEGLPRVLPQALSMGIPVVANRVDGIDEAVQEDISGYLCEPGNVEQMAKQCAYLIDHQNIRVEMGESGHRFASHEFDLNNMIAQIETLYDRLLNCQSG